MKAAIEAWPGPSFTIGSRSNLLKKCLKIAPDEKGKGVKISRDMAERLETQGFEGEFDFNGENAVFIGAYEDFIKQVVKSFDFLGEYIAKEGAERTRVEAVRSFLNNNKQAQDILSSINTETGEVVVSEDVANALGISKDELEIDPDTRNAIFLCRRVGKLFRNQFKKAMQGQEGAEEAADATKEAVTKGIAQMTAKKCFRCTSRH